MDYKQLRRVLRERLDAPGTEADETHMQAAEEAPAAVQELPVHDLPVNIAAMIGDEMVDPPVNDAEFLPGNLQQLQHAANVLVQNVPPLQVQDFYHKLRRLVTTSIRQQDRAGENQTDMLPEPSPDQELERADQEEANAEDQVDVTVAERIRRIAQTQVTEHRVRRAVKRVLAEQAVEEFEVEEFEEEDDSEALRSSKLHVLEDEDFIVGSLSDFGNFKKTIRGLDRRKEVLPALEKAEQRFGKDSEAGRAADTLLQALGLRKAPKSVSTEPGERRASGGEIAYETIAEDLFDEELKQNKDDLEVLEAALSDDSFSHWAFSEPLDKKRKKEVEVAIEKIKALISDMEAEADTAKKEGRRPRINPESKNITAQILRKFDIEFKLAPFGDRKIIDSARVREKLAEIRKDGTAALVDILDGILMFKAVNYLEPDNPNTDKNADQNNPNTWNFKSRSQIVRHFRPTLEWMSKASDPYRVAIMDIVDTVYDIPGVKIGKAKAADYRPGAKAIGGREGGSSTIGKLIKGMITKKIQDKIESGELVPPSNFNPSAWPDFNKYDANPVFKNALIPIIAEAHQEFEEYARTHRSKAKEAVAAYLRTGDAKAAEDSFGTLLAKIGDEKLRELVKNMIDKVKGSKPAADEN